MTLLYPTVPATAWSQTQTRIGCLFANSSSSNLNFNNLIAYCFEVKKKYVELDGPPVREAGRLWAP